jgi:hypothetical protein
MSVVHLQNVQILNDNAPFAGESCRERSGVCQGSFQLLITPGACAAVLYRSLHLQDHI